MADMTACEAIDRLRAAWRFKTDPVPEEAIRRILDAATKAASGGNAQPWRFIVVRDPALRAEIGRLYGRAWTVYRGAVERAFGARLDEQGRSMLAGAEALAKNFAAVPVHLLVGMRQPPPAFVLRDEAGASLDAGSVYSSIFPAVQNVVLAATALGLATRLITLHKIVEADLKTLLGIPEDVEIPALLPLGYPDGTFKRRPRLPLEAVTHWDRWQAKR
ncbi:MAG TPA: nitroreductase family protein [Candidatus Binatia bacterium]|nr:nitroreductase family protein [Candidatus Binatia bacterium]